MSALEPEPHPPATPASLPSWFDGEDAPQTPDLNTCIHCGLCLTACPTYRTLKVEPDSPRGRLYLMRGLAEGRISPSDLLSQAEGLFAAAQSEAEFRNSIGRAYYAAYRSRS